MTNLSNVLQYRKEVSNLDIGTEKEEKGNSTTAQSFLFRLAGLWVGEGTLLSKAVCLSRRVCLCSGQRGRKGPHTLLFLSFFFLFGLEPVTLLLQSPDCWDYRCMPTCLDCCCVIWKKDQSQNQKPSFPLQANLEKKHSTWWPKGQLRWGMTKQKSTGTFTQPEGWPEGTSPHSNQNDLQSPAGGWGGGGGEQRTAAPWPVTTAGRGPVATEASCLVQAHRSRKQGTLPAKNINKKEEGSTGERGAPTARRGQDMPVSCLSSFL